MIDNTNLCDIISLWHIATIVTLKYPLHECVQYHTPLLASSVPNNDHIWVLWIGIIKQHPHLLWFLQQIQKTFAGLVELQTEADNMMRYFGYACKNMSITQKRDSLSNITQQEKVLTDRTCRMDKFSITRANELALKNSADLLRILQWNYENSIQFFRIGSGIFPFIDHPVLQYNWTYKRQVLLLNAHYSDYRVIQVLTPVLLHLILKL